MLPALLSRKKFGGDGYFNYVVCHSNIKFVVNLCKEFRIWFIPTVTKMSSVEVSISPEVYFTLLQHSQRVFVTYTFNQEFLNLKREKVFLVK